MTTQQLYSPYSIRSTHEPKLLLLHLLASHGAFSQPLLCHCSGPASSGSPNTDCEHRQLS